MGGGQWLRGTLLDEIPKVVFGVVVFEFLNYPENCYFKNYYSEYIPIFTNIYKICRSYEVPGGSQSTAAQPGPEPPRWKVRVPDRPGC